MSWRESAGLCSPAIPRWLRCRCLAATMLVALARVRSAEGCADAGYPLAVTLQEVTSHLDGVHEGMRRGCFPGGGGRGVAAPAGRDWSARRPPLAWKAIALHPLVD